MLSRKIYNILSGDKDLYKKRYIKYKYILLFAKYLHRFLVADFCIPVFYALKMVIFVPRSARGTKKGQKNTSLECLGHKRGTKLSIWTLLIIIVKPFYLIDIQYVSLRLLLKIINLYKIR